MSLAVEKDLDIHQMDAVGAFPQGELQEENIFMEQPEGFKQGTMVCKLRKALYELKQAGRIWNTKFDKCLKEFGFKASDVDPCVYYLRHADKLIVITLWVDDLLILSNDPGFTTIVKNYPNENFKMKDLGEASSCLDIRITRDRKNDLLWLDQEQCTRSILARFSMSECNPADPNMKFSKEMSPTTEEEKCEMERVPYQEAVGCLMYLSLTTRPDIASAVVAMESRIGQLSNAYSDISE